MELAASTFDDLPRASASFVASQQLHLANPATSSFQSEVLTMHAALLFLSFVPQSPNALAPSELVWGDFDGDLLLDALVIDAQGARLLHNASDGVFEDLTALAGLAELGHVVAAAWGDFDLDGDQDLFAATMSGRLRLWRNSGATFEDSGESSGLSPALGIERAHWLDIDNDGWLDLHLHASDGELLYRNLSGGVLERVELEVVAPPVNGASAASADEAATLELARERTPSKPRIVIGSLGNASSPSQPPLGSAEELPTPGGSPQMVGTRCPQQLKDVVTLNCVPLSTVPTLGTIYPLGPEFNIAASGRVGVNTTSPAYRLHVVDADTAVFGQGGLYGVRGDANQSGGSGFRYGGYFTASGGANNIGAYGSGGIGAYGAGLSTGVFGITYSASGRGLDARAESTTGSTIGVYGQAASTAGTAVLGSATATTGDTIGVRGTTASTGSNSTGVKGEGFTTGVSGVATSTIGRGVYGSATNTSSGGIGVLGEAASDNGVGVKGSVASTTGSATGVVGTTGSLTGSGVAGEHTNTLGNGVGVYGVTSSSDDATAGVLGRVSSFSMGANAAGVRGTVFGIPATSGIGVDGVHSGSGTGVRGTSASGIGVLGTATATSGSTVGVSGTSSSSSGTGVLGTADSTSGTTYGVRGVALSPGGVGVIGSNNNTGAGATGVLGLAGGLTPGANAAGVRGQINSFGATSDGVGVEGTHNSQGIGVKGSSSLGVGVEGVHVASTGSEPGVRGETLSTDANAVGVLGEIAGSSGTDAAGVKGNNADTGGNGYGVLGTHAGTGVGVYGSSGALGGALGGIGLRGRAGDGLGGIGVSGEASIGGQFAGTESGVEGTVNGGSSAPGFAEFHAGKFAAHADATGNMGFPVYVTAYGVHAVATESHSGANALGYAIGVYGFAATQAGNYAGYFGGDLYATAASASVKAFKIDHPLDPENKYLCHSCVESPDMKNIYDGIAVLDARGSAWVELPAWFEALNRDYRYQLTPIGAPALVFVAKKIAGNRFEIGGPPGLEVSWQVTGIRKDATAEARRVVVEQDKPERERGLYLDAQAFGFDHERSVDHVLHEQGSSPRREK